MEGVFGGQCWVVVLLIRHVKQVRIRASEQTQMGTKQWKFRKRPGGGRGESHLPQPPCKVTLETAPSKGLWRPLETCQKNGWLISARLPGTVHRSRRTWTWDWLVWFTTLSRKLMFPSLSVGYTRHGQHTGLWVTTSGVQLAAPPTGRGRGEEQEEDSLGQGCREKEPFRGVSFPG